MAAAFVSFDALLAQLRDTAFDTPPAIVCNAHITGLGVARALKQYDIPVIAVDRTSTGVAPRSTAVDFAGHITYPLDDQTSFKTDIEAISDTLEHDPVVFPCMDEWVLAFATTQPDGVRLPFSSIEIIDTVLNKRELYDRADQLGIPYPETYSLENVDPDEAADELGFPVVIKPAYKREFEEALGTNVIQANNYDEYYEAVDTATAHGIEVLVQERIPITPGADCSLGSYLPRDSNRAPVTFVGNPITRYPQSFGTSCVVQPTNQPTIETTARQLLTDAGYVGISEAEYVYHDTREEHVLLDINTRPWKWIGLPVTAGANLPYAAYAEATGTKYHPDPIADTRWVYLPDYFKLLATTSGFTDVLSESDWEALITGSFQHASPPQITTGLYRPTDPLPTHQALTNEFTTVEYYCAC